MAIQILSFQYPESNTQDTCISSINPSLGFGNLQYLRLGRDNVGSKWRILIKPDISLLPFKAKILKAEIRLRCYESNSGIYDMYQITSGWNENITWSGQPNYNLSIIQQQNLSTLTGNWYIWDILSLVAKWVAEPNYGIIIKANNENIFNYTSFYSSSIGDQGSRPIFYFEYIDQMNRKAVLLKESFKGNIFL